MVWVWALDVKYNGRALFTKLYFANYQPLALSRFAVGAGTGGLNASHWIDDRIALNSAGPAREVPNVRGWFPDHPEVWQQFMPFGRGACGDVYALWVHGPGVQPDTAPVVMFGSDGELVVLASSALDFCRLLCLGYSEVGVDAPSSTPRDFAKTERFRAFMMARYGFVLPDTAAPIVAAAEASVPCFADFVEARR